MFDLLCQYQFNRTQNAIKTPETAAHAHSFGCQSGYARVGNDHMDIAQFRKVIGFNFTELAGIGQKNVARRGLDNSSLIADAVCVNAGNTQRAMDSGGGNKGLIGPMPADKLHRLV